MDAALAGLLAPLPKSVSEKFDKGLFQQSEEVLSRRAAATGGDTSVSSPDSADGDRVTLLGADAQGAGVDTTGIYDLLRSMRDSFGSGSNVAGTSSFQSLSSFSFQASFARLTTSNGAVGTGGGIQGMLGDLDQLYEDLMSYSPEQAQRLSILARVLAALNPEGAENMLRTIHDTLQRFAAPAASQAAAAIPTPEAAPAPSAEVPEGGTVVEMVHFELDFEMTMTSDVSTALVELRDQGINVQTTRVQTSQSIRIHIEFTGMREEVRQSDPLVFDLNGDGVNLTSVADGAQFDIDGDGRTDQTAFVQGDDAFLALDRNGNGRIDSGHELFGDQHGAKNGFEELARFDGNGDGRIDASDAVYNDLRLLYDVNGDGKVGRNETVSLADRGIDSIDLGYSADAVTRDTHGNTLAERGAFVWSDGRTGAIVDAWVGYET